MDQACSLTGDRRLWLQQRLLTQIPLAVAMQLEVTGCEEGVVSLCAPLAPNNNHAGTGFGGSLYSLAVLACWSVLNVALADENLAAQVVIVDGHADYLHPVRGDFSASSALTDIKAWERALKALHQHGKGRIALSSDVLFDRQICVRFSGRFVLLPEDANA